MKIEQKSDNLKFPTFLIPFPFLQFTKMKLGDCVVRARQHTWATICCSDVNAIKICLHQHIM